MEKFNGIPNCYIRFRHLPPIHEKIEDFHMIQEQMLRKHFANICRAEIKTCLAQTNFYGKTQLRRRKTNILWHACISDKLSAVAMSLSAQGI